MHPAARTHSVIVVRAPVEIGAAIAGARAMARTAITSLIMVETMKRLKLVRDYSW